MTSGRPAASLVGMTRQEARGCSLFEVLPAQHHDNFARTLAGESVRAEGKIPTELREQEPWHRVTTFPIRDQEGVVQGGMVIVVDVSAQKRADELIEKLAFIDPVTELPNCAMLSMMLSRTLSGEKAKQRQLALVWLNLDRFKDVNDALG